MLDPSDCGSFHRSVEARSHFYGGAASAPRGALPRCGNLGHRLRTLSVRLGVCHARRSIVVIRGRLQPLRMPYRGLRPSDVPSVCYGRSPPWKARLRRIFHSGAPRIGRRGFVERPDTAKSHCTEAALAGRNSYAHAHPGVARTRAAWHKPCTSHRAQHVHTADAWLRKNEVGS